MSSDICETTGKKCFTKKDAATCINGLARNRRRRKIHSALPKRYYFCEHCGMYHLTHYKQRKARKDHKLY